MAQVRMLLLLLWLLLCVVYANTKKTCLNLSLFNIHPITNQGGVDGKAVLTGELFQLGDFDDCVYRRQATYCLSRLYLNPINSTAPLSAYIQYHGEWWTHYRRDYLRWAVCAPRQCREPEHLVCTLEEALADAGQELGVKTTVSIRRSDCFTAEDQPYTPVDYVLGGLLVLIVVLLLTGTAYDFSQEYIFSCTQKNTPQLENNTHWLQCFSVRSNITRLHSECVEPRLAAIQGIRFLVMFGIIAGHCLYINLQAAVTNVHFIEQRYEEWLSMLFANGHLIVSAFFVISGFLRAYQFLGEAARNGGVSARMVFSGLLLRYLRLTPALVVVIVLSASWLYHVGSGPLWQEFLGRVSSNCRQNWWTNLLYVNNYLHYDTPCLDHTWYLGVDWQLFVLSAVPLVLLHYWQTFTIVILATCISASVIVSFLHTYTYKLRATVITVPVVLQNLFADDTFLYGYTSVQSNALPYVIGVTFGVVYHRLASKKIHKLWVIKWWLLLLPLLFSPVLSSYCFYQPRYKYQHLLESLYASIYKLPFSYAVASAIMLFATGYGWIVNDILSCKPCVVLGRLTYSTYLVHFLWQYIEAGSRRLPLYLNALQLMRAAFLDLLFSFIWGFILCMTVEMPTSAIVKHLLRQKPADKKETETPSQPTPN